MAKVNSSYVDASGNTVILYACASINDAYEVGGISGQESNSKLITANLCLNESETFGVTLTNNTGLDYAGDLIVAYDDLVPYYGDVDVLPKSESLLLGVLKLTQSGLADETAYRIHSAEEINSNYLIPINLNDSSSRMGEHKIKSVLTDGRIIITIGPEQDNVVSVDSYKIHGLDIVLKDFITDDFLIDDLTMSSITLTDNLQKSTPNTSTNYGYDNDTSDFNINSQTYQNIVVSSGSLKVCAFVNGQYEYQDTLQTKYTNWNESSLVNFLLLLDSSIMIEDLPVNTLVSTILVEFELLKVSGGKVFRTLTIDVWFKENHPDTPELTPTPAPVDIIPDPYTIYYRTSDSKEISELTDEKAAGLSPGNVFVNRGYDETLDCGWIRFENPILELDGRGIFSNYIKLAQIVYWPTLLQKILENSFVMPDSDSFSVRYIDLIPDTIIEIGNFAFLNFGLINTLTIKINSDWATLHPFSFANNNISKLVFSTPKTYDKPYLSVYGAFLSCLLLEEVSDAERVRFERLAFKNCTSLKRVGKFLYFPLDSAETFKGCTSLEKIKFINTGTRYHHHSLIDISELVLDACCSLTDVYIQLPEDNMYSGYDNYGFYKTTFFGCKNVKNLYVNAKHPPFLGILNINKKNAINPATCKLYVPIGRTAAYNSKAEWGEFPLSNIIEYTPELFAEVENSILNCATRYSY